MLPPILFILYCLKLNFSHHVPAELLQNRILREKQIEAGQLPDFLPQTKVIREDPTWKGPPPGPGLEDRRVEITGPVDRKMIINALNSGASTFMADLEGSQKKTFFSSYKNYFPSLTIFSMFDMD